MTTGELIQAIVRGVDDPKAIEGWDLSDPQRVRFSYDGDHFQYRYDGLLTRLKDGLYGTDQVSRALEEALSGHTPHAHAAPGLR